MPWENGKPTPHQPVRRGEAHVGPELRVHARHELLDIGDSQVGIRLPMELALLVAEAVLVLQHIQ